jgi:nucleotide-binding universal stress UspA family protein
MPKNEQADRRTRTEADLAASRARREALHTAADVLERGVAALETDPDAARFANTLREVLRTVHEHVDEVESADGLLDEMLALAPRYGHRIEQLRLEHEELLTQARDLLRRAERHESPETFAGDGRALAEHMTAHRHRGTELFQDAFLIDVPASD